MDIKSLLLQLNQQKASDLLLVAGAPPCLRINNLLHKQGTKALTGDEISAMMEEFLGKEKLKEFANWKELDTAAEDPHSRYRVNLHYQLGTIAATIRRIPRQIPSMDDLGLPNKVKEFTTLERGLILVTGPTGCGKSTTQASMIDAINANRACHIVTVEDPIEFVHAQKQAIIEQREVGLDTMSFGEALKRVLRQIPDVILVGEMRDIESIQAAIIAAETGHLVMGTLHTQDAVQSVDRLIEVFPPHQQSQVRSMLSLVLFGIVSQQLVPRKDGQGLALAMEVLVATPAVRNIIRKGATQDIYSMIDLGQKYGMLSMDSSLVDLAKKNIISNEEAVAYAINRERVETKLGVAPKSSR